MAKDDAPGQLLNQLDGSERVGIKFGLFVVACPGAQRIECDTSPAVMKHLFEDFCHESIGICFASIKNSAGKSVVVVSGDTVEIENITDAEISARKSPSYLGDQVRSDVDAAVF